MLWWKFAKILMSFSKPQGSFSSNFTWLFISWKITPQYFFRSKIIYFPQKGPIKVQILETFQCSDQNSPNSCQFWNKKLVFVQILHQFLVSWGITPLHFFLAEIVYTFNKRSLRKYKFSETQLSSWNFPETLHFDELLL